MRPLKIDVTTLHFMTGLPSYQLRELLLGRQDMDRRTAILLSGALGTEPEFWLTAQSEYDAEERSRHIAGDARNAGVSHLLFGYRKGSNPHPNVPAALRCECCGCGCKTHEDHLCPKAITILFVWNETSTGMCEDCANSFAPGKGGAQ